MAFIEFETEEAYNEAINAKVSEAVETAINDKSQAWLPDRLKKTHDKAVAETEARFSDYDQIKEALATINAEKETWTSSKVDYEKQISRHALEVAKLNAALKYGIALEDVNRLIGDTPEAIDKDAQTFASMHSRKPTYPTAGSEGGEVDGVTAYLKAKYPNTYK